MACRRALRGVACHDGAMDVWQVTLWASTIATAVATSAAVLASVWWRHHDRTQADWLITGANSVWVIERPGIAPWPPHLRCRLMNSGDGTAYRLSLIGLGCAPIANVVGGTVVTEVHPVAGPGAAFDLEVYCEPELWDRATLRLEWVESPTWKDKVHYLDLPLAGLAAVPQPTAREMNPVSLAEEYVTVADPGRPALPDHIKVSRPAPAKVRRRRRGLVRWWQS